MEAHTEIQVLIRRAQRGDQEAFDGLAHAHYDRVRALIRRWRSGDPSTEDIVQETFLRAFEHLPRFQWQGEGSFQRWLAGIARNVFLEYVRRQGRMPLIGLKEGPPAATASQSRALRREERFARLQDSLHRLSFEHREVIRLARFEGLPLSEVAQRMHRSHGAVRQLLVRALKKVKLEFGDTESLHLPRRPLDEDDEQRERTD